ncbi:3-oxoadipate enol-lactonase/4-carboxymuconolactone decarboxylase [Streptomyces sp. DSM 41269]|nr:3-oxoadipate enol-lactonase/4-carboxymuconolactone decarboxylase [Streptomyces sp. DSM 41269]
MPRPAAPEPYPDPAPTYPVPGGAGTPGFPQAPVSAQPERRAPGPQATAPAGPGPQGPFAPQPPGPGTADGPGPQGTHAPPVPQGPSGPFAPPVPQSASGPFAPPAPQGPSGPFAPPVPQDAQATPVPPGAHAAPIPPGAHATRDPQAQPIAPVPPGGGQGAHAAGELPRTLQYRFDGPEDAPVLVIGPSLGTTWHMWDRQIPELSQHWRVFRYDLPGHGGAPAHAAASVADLADRLLATLDGLGVQRFGYAGCSIGGAVGADLALRHPHRVASLALVASSPRFGTADEFRQRGVIVRTNGLEPMARTAPERWFTPGFAAAQPAIVEWAVQMVRTTDPGCYIAACEALAAFDIRGALGRIGVPTLVLVGAEDQVTGPAEARTLVAGIPDARLALVPGASHLAPVEQPVAVSDLLLTHFSTAWQQDTSAAIPVLPQAPGAAGSAATFAPVAEIAPAAVPDAAEPAPDDRYDRGTRVRREVLGDSHVDAAHAASDAFTEDFQELVTRYAWGEVWSRDGLDRRTRSVITLTALVASGHPEGLAAHTRAALRNGLTPAEIKEILLQTAVYCGLPAAGAAFAVAGKVIQEETTPPA